MPEPLLHLGNVGIIDFMSLRIIACSEKSEVGYRGAAAATHRYRWPRSLSEVHQAFAFQARRFAGFNIACYVAAIRGFFPRPYAANPSLQALIPAGGTGRRVENVFYSAYPSTSHSLYPQFCTCSSRPQYSFVYT
jgi:hypothetical protein